MKTNVKLLIAIALMATACTTGSKVTSGGYSDDLYFTPGEAQPAAPKPVKEVKQPQQKSTVMMQVEENEQGKVVNNYVVPKSSRKDKNTYYFDDQPAYTDTTLEYKDNKEQLTVNNYYEGEEMDYSTRIRTFYDPYFYDSYWDPYWGYGSGYGYGGFGLSFGWGGYYPGWGYGGYYPYYPYYGYGWGYGGYYPYYPFYGWGGGYYPGYGGGYYAGGNGTYYTGKQHHTGKRGESNAVRYGMNSTKSGSLSGSSSSIGRNLNSASTRLQSGNSINGTVAGSRQVTGGAGATGTRLSNTRGTTINQQTQSLNNVQSTRSNRGETISNLRRSGTNNIQGVGAVNQSNSSSRPVTSGRDYTPTYNRPRMNTQATYNNGASRQFTTPQSNSSNYQSGGRYSRPQSTGGGASGSVRSAQPSSYQHGSVGSSQSRSTSTEGRSSSGYSGSGSSRSYSVPSSSSGSTGGSYSGGTRSGSFSGGGSSSGGGGAVSGGGNTGGGGGGGRTR